jgi:hypothetical protein
MATVDRVIGDRVIGDRVIGDRVIGPRNLVIASSRSLHVSAIGAAIECAILTAEDRRAWAGESSGRPLGCATAAPEHTGRPTTPAQCKRLQPAPSR